ncbi:MAG TPA: DUF4278 domain-containing protein [Leptolyngbyaceae cyanobacterium]
MTFFFIIPLAVVPIAVYIYKASADEMAYLAAAISLVSLVLSLILAPWQLKLVLLMLALLSSKQLWLPIVKLFSGKQSKSLIISAESKIIAQSIENKTETDISQLENSADNLVYRGVNYHHTTLAPKVSDSEITVKYRGQVCKISHIEEPTTAQPNFEIKYRGACVNQQQSLVCMTEQPDEVEQSLVSVVQE